MKTYAVILAVLIVLITPIALTYQFCAKRTLFVYMWSDYVQPGLLERFQEKYDCRIVVDTYDSNEAMYTKLKLGGAGYDVVFPSNYFLELMAGQDMLLPIEESHIPNHTYIDWPFVLSLGIPQKLHGIPYMASFSGIGWRKDRLLHAPTSWSIFGDPALHGRMTMLNDMRETLGAALLFLGYSANTDQPEEIEQATKTVCMWKKQLAKLESEQYKNGLANSEYFVVQGYSGDCLQVARASKNVAFSYPKEGSLVSIDYAAILKSSHDPELAYQFINFLHDPIVAAQNANFTNYRCLNTEARKFLPEELQHSPFMYPEELEPAVHLQCIKPVPAARKAYIRAWDTVKSSDE